MIPQTQAVALPGDDDILTCRQAADILGLTEATLAQYRHAKNHPLKFIRLNHQVVRYRRGDIRDYLRERTVAPSQPLSTEGGRGQS